MASELVQGIGRRREAVARVRLMKGNSPMMVNAKPISEVYKGRVLQSKYQKPFELTKTLGEYTATIKVVGGGQVSQLEAIIHGAARALSKISQDNKEMMKKHGLLTRDPRARERRKPGQKGRARFKPSSPKR